MLDPIGNKTVNEQNLLGFNVTAFDPDGDSVILSASGLPPGASFNLATGEFAWTPDEAQQGVYNVTFTATDDRTPVLSDSETITITVNEVNDAPLAVNDEYVIDEDSLLDFVAPGVLGNDSDVEGDILAALLLSGPSHGTLTLNPDGSFRYLPQANFNGVDFFTYKANDGSAESEAATVTITVNPVNDPPVAANIEITTTSAAVTIPVFDHVTDVDGQPLAVIGVTQPTWGAVSINPDGTVTYTLARFSSGADSFTYTVTDGQGGTATATVTINLALPPAAGIEMLRSQIDDLSLGRGQKKMLDTELRLADWLLDRGFPRAAAVQLRVFALHISLLERRGRLEAATADLLIEEAQELIDLIL